MEQFQVIRDFGQDQRLVLDWLDGNFHCQSKVCKWGKEEEWETWKKLTALEFAETDMKRLFAIA